MKGTVLYVSRAGFPDTASGMRIYEIGKILKALDYKVHYISALYSCFVPTSAIDINNKFPDNDNHYRFDDFIYSFRGNKDAGKIKTYFEIISANKLFNRVKQYCEQEDITHIILYNDPFQLTVKLSKYCKDKGIRVIADVSEWYRIFCKHNISNLLIAGLVNARIHFFDQRLDGIIAISDYLYSYYKKKLENVIMIPPLCNIENVEAFHDNIQRPMKIVYAGSPGTKDIIVPFIKAVNMINIKDIKFELNIIGVRQTDYKLSANSVKGVFFHGRLSHEETLNYVKASDFGILLRHNKRYARAGFSTKLVECMSVGTPMICNRIGGSDKVISSWKNGILINSMAPKHICRILEKIYQLNDDEIKEIKLRAYQYARDNFTSEKYIDLVDGLLNK